MIRKKSWTELLSNINSTFRKWKIVDSYLVEPRKAPKQRNQYHSPSDRFIKITFTAKGKKVFLTCSSELIAHDNLELLALALESMRMNDVRGITQYVVLGYAQMYPGRQPEAQKKVDENDPYVVLGVGEHYSLPVIETIWKARLRVEHPDTGGSEAVAKKLNAAMSEIRQRRS